MSERLADLTPENRRLKCWALAASDNGDGLHALLAALRDADRRAGALEELRWIHGFLGEPWDVRLDKINARIAELEGGE